jgi:hypothetical protein
LILTLESDADVVTLQHLGCSDTDISAVSATELMMYALANFQDKEREGGYAVRHSSRPVSDFGRTVDGTVLEKNPIEAAYPALFPYGEGGIESERPQVVAFSTHIQWCLMYYDGRFPRHHSFPFVVFGILQKRKALMSTRLQMKQKDFLRAAKMWTTLTPSDFSKASLEETNGQKISDPRMNSLRRHIFASAGRILGSNQARFTYRRQIWSTIVAKNPPSLWVTINPNDIDSPVAQVLAGAEIDLDLFRPEEGPDADTRSRNIAENPLASAMYFNFIIETTLETLFGVKATPASVTSKVGVLGVVDAYYGVVEAQGRGTLHLHMLLWLRHAPTATEMKELLQQDAFRDRLKNFIKANIRAHVDGLDEEGIKATRREKGIAYSRPPDPDSPTYEEEAATFTKRVVRSQQVHTCQRNTCLRLNGQGNLVCKRHAPWPLADEDIVDEQGNWQPKRTYSFLNSWQPSVSEALACNNDIQLISHGSETQSVVWYITGYQTKGQHKTYNLSALLANTTAYHMKDTRYQGNVSESNRLLLFRCLHEINGKAEYSGPQVLSYLMGWNDVFRSHNYAVVFWSTVTGELIRSYPDLKSNDCR